MAKAKRRKKAAPVRRRRRVGRKKNASTKTKRSAAARKAARTRAANKHKRSLAAKKAARSRKRKNPGRKTRTRKRSGWTKAKRRAAGRKAARTRSRRKNPSRRRRRKNYYEARRWARPKHIKGAMKGHARKGRYKTKRRRKNPSRASYRRRYTRRRNPGDLMGLMMTRVVPVAASLYMSRLISGKLAGKIPGLDKIDEKYRSPALAAILFGAGHFLTGNKSPVKMLKKHREGIMVGLGINLLDKILGAFAPENVKSMFGVSAYDEDIYGPALSDYVSVDDYVAIGDVPPIQDDITLADYVQIGDDGLEQDLGMEMDLGDFANRHLGGVSRSAMQAPSGHKKYLAPVPARPFTTPVPDFSKGFDNPNRLYTGIFSGGFGF